MEPLSRTIHPRRDGTIVPILKLELSVPAGTEPLLSIISSKQLRHLFPIYPIPQISGGSIRKGIFMFNSPI